MRVTSLAFGFGGGNGIPSATPVTSFAFGIGGGGGNGMPSATCLWIASFVLVSRLTDWLAGTTMDPMSSANPETRPNCLKRMEHTSWCDPLRFLADVIFGVQNVPIAEQWP
jgi:hypothetical protein